MCGVAGFLFTHQEVDDPRGVITRMAESLLHRGPDDAGSWVDEAAGVALGHRRLAVIDLSVDGRQPMISHGGRYVLSYNGEIYNFSELREELASEGARFQGALGHRGAPRRSGNVGAGGGYRAIRRHVRLRLVGSHRKNAASRARQDGRETPVLRLASKIFSFRLGTQIPPRAPGLGRRDFNRLAGPVYEDELRSRPVLHLPGDPQAAARLRHEPPRFGSRPDICRSHARTGVRKTW